MDKFLKYLDWLLAHEGGFVHHKSDPGGATNYGITQAVYNDYLAASGKKPQSVSQIARREVEGIYRVKYWLRIKGDELSTGWDYAMFDFGVNSGPQRAIKFAQLAVGVPDDGVLGPKTLAAIKAAPPEALDKYFSMRRDFLVSLKTFPTFGKGWMRRVDEVEAKAKSLLKK